MIRSDAFKVTLAILCAGCVGCAGCAPLGLWWQERNAEVPMPVVALPDGYDPTKPHRPYAGPHPSRLALAIDRTAYPVRIGEVGPIDEALGPLQYPFACQTGESGLGQPLVDNHDGWGTPVLDNGTIIGYSKDCLIPTVAGYYYMPRSGRRLLPFDDSVDLEDVERVAMETSDTSSASGPVGKDAVPFVVRVERGTINRFIYAIAMLADPEIPLSQPSTKYWNGRLIYHFRGGVGIGKRQGKAGINTVTTRRLGELAQGYALAYSTGNHTSNQYNVWLAGRTAAMVKAQFEAQYGTPEFTMGIGASGGAVQQYLIAQNQPGLLDGLIPVYSYPDMITQTNWALDCELLEYYFDVTARDQDRWRDQRQRSLISGLASDNGAENLFNEFDDWARLLSFRLPRQPPGATECAASWRGLTPLTNNPSYTNKFRYYAPDLLSSGRWSHWHDLQSIYGVNDAGFAHRTYSNEGVQYGLSALVGNKLTPAEFLHLNANVGTWKPPRQMAQERFWLLSGQRDLRAISIWSDHNMQKTPGGASPLAAFERKGVVRPAPRSRGDPAAIEAAFRSGHVFLGNIELPVVDVRHYLDPQLDMHHSFASLSARARLLDTIGANHNQLIWVADPNYDPSPRAVALLDRWLSTGPGKGRPVDAQDTCFAADGRAIATGRDVWNGAWNGLPAGACTTSFPPFRSPRNVAGEPISGMVFRCRLQSTADALAGGVYGDVDMQPHAELLQQVFPRGVCDYSVPGIGQPPLDALI